jgi:hypothetical protein
MSSSINASFTMTDPCSDDVTAEIHPLETPKLRQCSRGSVIIAALRRFRALRNHIPDLPGT